MSNSGELPIKSCFLGSFPFFLYRSMKKIIDCVDGKSKKC